MAPDKDALAPALGDLVDVERHAGQAGGSPHADHKGSVAGEAAPDRGSVPGGDSILEHPKPVEQGHEEVVEVGEHPIVERRVH